MGFVVDKVDTGTVFFSYTSTFPCYYPSTDVPFYYAKNKLSKLKKLPPPKFFVFGIWTALDRKAFSQEKDCTVEDVEYIYNTLRLYFCCWMCILSLL